MRKPEQMTRRQLQIALKGLVYQGCNIGIELTTTTAKMLEVYTNFYKAYTKPVPERADTVTINELSSAPSFRQFSAMPLDEVKKQSSLMYACLMVIMNGGLNQLHQ